MLVVPMLFEGRSVGVIALSKLGNNQFSNDDLQTMTIFAGYAAQAIGQRRRLRAAGARSRPSWRGSCSRSAACWRSTSDCCRPSTGPSVLETIADGLKAVVRYDNLSIYGVDEGQRVLIPVLTRERHEEEVRALHRAIRPGLMGWARRARGAGAGQRCARTTRARMQIPGTPDDPEALVVVPLMADGDVIGCMNISRIGGAEIYFSDADFELVKLFAGQASIALRNADAHQAIAHAGRDRCADRAGQPRRRSSAPWPTCSASRRPDRGGRRRAAPPAGPVALLMMDLDNFKAYNDRLGHPAGDALLHAIGAAIYGSARGEDRVFRYGGDEFAVLLPGRRRHGPPRRSASESAAVARLTAKEAARVTITVGVAAYPDDAVDKNDLIAAADIALYLGKQSGEDRVVRADDVPHEMRDLRSTLDQLARAALLHPDDAPTVDSLVEQAALLSHATEHGQDTVRDALLGVARSLDALDPAAIGHGERVGRLAGLVARRLGCDEGAADTVELAARLQGLEGVGADELEPIPSLREVGEIVRWHRAGGPLDAGAARRPGAGGIERVRRPGCLSGRTARRPARCGRRTGRGGRAALRPGRGPGAGGRGRGQAAHADAGGAPATTRRGSAERPDGLRARCYDRASLCRATSPPPRARHHPAWPPRSCWRWWHCRRAARPRPVLPRAHRPRRRRPVRWPAHRPCPARRRLPRSQRRRYTNPPDPELAALIPTRLRGVAVEVPATSEFAITPGDFASAYGDLGLQFKALQVAFVIDPRLSLYAARVEQPLPTTRQLEPYLETAGRYVGIAGLHREPWRYRSIGGRATWERPEDNATAAGTHIYTWAADDYVFLLIGVDDQLNRAMFAALPGERAPAQLRGRRPPRLPSRRRPRRGGEPLP